MAIAYKMKEFMKAKVRRQNEKRQTEQHLTNASVARNAVSAAVAESTLQTDNQDRKPQKF